MKTSRLTSIVLLAALTGSSHTLYAAGGCSQSEVDHYLDRGFTPAQVVQLCGTAAPVVAPAAPPEPPPAPKAMPAPAAPAMPAATTNSAPGAAASVAAGSQRPASLSEEQWYELKNAIEADEVTFEGGKLIYTRDRCHKFGSEDFAGFKEKACVITRTTIAPQGLKIVNAQKYIFLIQDAELIVSGNIKREVLNADSLKPKIREGFLAEFSTSPEKLDIPIKKGFEPPKIARHLEKMAQP